MNPNARICFLSGTNAGRRVSSFVPDGSSEGRMQYAPTAYRRKRPFLPIYLGASRREKKKRVEGRSPIRRGVLHTPHKWPRQGTNTGRRVPSLVPDGSSERRMQYAPTAYRKKRPLLPIYLGASRNEKEKGGEGRIPLRRGVLHTPHKWPRKGTNAGRRVPSFLLLIEEKKAKEDQGLCRGRRRWGGCA